jgi:hypothetical protein
VGLEVEPYDLDGPHLADLLRQQVDLGADQVGDVESLLVRQEVDPDLAIGLPSRVGHF